MMNPNFEVFSQGEEIVTGQVVDSNAAWLSEQAVVMGFNVIRHTAVGDKLEDLVQVLLEISNRADCCICTGGLGPTIDDLTAEAVAEAFGLSLEFDEIAFNQIQQFFQKRNRPFPECNRKQAMLPKGSVRLDNFWGTAPGFALQCNRCWFAFLPGVPSEMKQLFIAHIKPIMTDRFVLRPGKLITIKTVGIGESDLQEKIKAVEIPFQVQLGFRAKIGEVQTKLLFSAGYPSGQLESLVQQVVGTIGDAVFAIDGLDNQPGELVSIIDQLMTARRQTLAVVETLSQGLLMSEMVGVSWLLSAVFEQSIAKLAQRLDVNYDADDLFTTAKAIARAIQKNTGADLVLVQMTSLDSDISSSNDKAVTIINTLLANGEYKQTTRAIAGDRKRKQHQSALLSLDLLRRYLQGKELFNPNNLRLPIAAQD